MDINKVVEEFTRKAAKTAPLGKKLKVVIDDQPILIDGTGDDNVVSQSDDEADCTVSTGYDNFMKIVKGELNPMMAVMTGKVKVKGEMGVAMKLKDLLG